MIIGNLLWQNSLKAVNRTWHELGLEVDIICDLAFIGGKHYEDFTPSITITDSLTTLSTLIKGEYVRELLITDVIQETDQVTRFIQDESGRSLTSTGVIESTDLATFSMVDQPLNLSMVIDQTAMLEGSMNEQGREVIITDVIDHTLLITRGEIPELLITGDLNETDLETYSDPRQIWISNEVTEENYKSMFEMDHSLILSNAVIIVELTIEGEDKEVDINGTTYETDNVSFIQTHRDVTIQGSINLTEVLHGNMHELGLLVTLNDRIDVIEWHTPVPVSIPLWRDLPGDAMNQSWSDIR